MKIRENYVKPVAGSFYDEDLAAIAKEPLGTVFELDNVGEGRDGIPVADKDKHKNYIQAAFTRAGVGARFQEFVAYEPTEFDEDDNPIQLGGWIVKSSVKREPKSETEADEVEAEAPAKA